MVQSRKAELEGFKPWRAYYDAIELNVKHDWGTFVVSQQQIDDYRTSLEDPGAMFTDIRATGDYGRETRQSRDVGAGGAQAPGAVNARTIREYFNPPIPGQTLHLTHRVVEKYIRRDLPYVVEEYTASDAGGRLVERMTIHHMVRNGTLGEKWTRDAEEASKKFSQWVQAHPENR